MAYISDLHNGKSRGRLDTFIMQSWRGRRDAKRKGPIRAAYRGGVYQVGSVEFGEPNGAIPTGNGNLTIGGGNKQL